MHTIPCSTYFLFLIIIFVFVASQPLALYDDEKFRNCSNQFECGPINVTYPFWGNGRIQDCGRPGFELKCQDNYTVIEAKLERYRVLQINQDNRIITIVRMDIFRDGCTLEGIPFSSASKNPNLTFLFNCSQSPSLISYNFTCPINNVASEGFYVEESARSDLFQLCKKRILVPFHQVPFEDLQLGLPKDKGFKLEYKEEEICPFCVKTHGQCGYDRTAKMPICFYCQPKGNASNLVMITAIAASAAGIGVLMIIFYCFIQKKKPQNCQNVEAFFRNNAPLVSKRYSYSEVKKMTNSFRVKLGQGGYGGVYKGKLNDGSLVAVKVLNESKGNGEEFINEVASISRTSHVNIVTLLGFCFEGSKRALIYEFMPNGSLEKFIYGETPSNADRLLGWESLYQIAFGIAKGLEYLHRGCNTRILHFDIKPHNILLDKEFSPKISDFGLAKICPRKESIISMTGARGTAGYIAPEVFCRNFGGISHKSDVYSYGMMVLEMVGGRKNICVGVDRTSEIYFPQWICKRIELGEELQLQGVRDEEEKKIARKMILVGLWCIQTDPSNRPPMSRVVEMLQGSVESLPIPPTPFLSSPPRTVENSSTTSITAL